MAMLSRSRTALRPKDGRSQGQLGKPPQTVGATPPDIADIQELWLPCPLLRVGPEVCFRTEFRALDPSDLLPVAWYEFGARTTAGAWREPFRFDEH